MAACFEIHNWTVLALEFVNWWCGGWLDLPGAVGLPYGWNSSHFTCHKSMAICIHCQRQFILLNNAQQCYMFRSVRQPVGINVHDLKTNGMC